MLKMAQQQYIKHLYEMEEKSLAEIARTMKLNYRTVRKYALKDDWSKDDLPNLEPDNYPILGKFIPVINEWLENDKKIPRKQRHTCKRIYDRLKKENGYTGSYSSVKRYVRKKRSAMRMKVQGCLPLNHPCGEAQVDFGELIYYDAQGKECTAYSLVMSFPYSNKAYIQVFPSQNQECLLEGMKRIFEYIGGVPTRIRFDNMSTAVAQILEGTERKLTDGFTRFMLHYRFEADFCNPASGNEKGNVENKVGYSRRNAFVPVPTITFFDEFNESMWNWCEEDAKREHYSLKKPIEELWLEDKEKLLVMPENPYSIFRYESLAVDKTGFANIDTNKYGLSPVFAGKTVQAKIYYNKIEFFFDRQIIGSFKRSYGKNQEIYDWTQYISTLCKKPRALENTRFFSKLPDMWREHLAKTFGQERKSALQLLEEIVSDGNTALCNDTIQLALENGRTDTDSLRQCYYMISRREYRPVPLKLDAAPVMVYDPNLSVYDSLTGGEEHG